MKYLVLFLICFGSIIATGEDCKPEDFASFAQVKGAVHRVVSSGMYTGWDDKTFSRAGDMTAIALLKTVSDDELVSPKILKMELVVLRLAFGCPSRCISVCSDREPRVTILLLENLHHRTKGKARSEVDKVKKFILQQITNQASPN